ncbi:hypothetical protein C8A01DRAFT_43532 [Parachaetomium inaequale]|uniref:Myb-like domain-containing protein n=1 Tax=Parachaetomium inaequale TaxID=2588326 RepID=A0AAN6SUH9_9PEZI|nr:hypothetical protein C8A01DRAFT_43532 [Parachaetomium inaequale]
MNKNWNDRADKDLFFTILSVKNIGVISGSEWTTIGNHMRSMGYGFTNEGCRQHFQGLRRAQNKTENGATGESPRKVDPTQNPITRRPGPGRGRPRKQPVAEGAAVGPDGMPAPGVHPVGAPPAGVAPGAPGAPPLVPGAAPVPGMAHGVPVHPQFAGLPGVPAAPPTPGSAIPGAPGTPAMPNVPPAHGLPVTHGQPQPHPPQVSQGIAPQAQMTAHEDLAVDPGLDEEPEDDHAAKRQRLDDSQEPSLEDEAVLNALAGHNNPATPGEYTTEYTYGDA